jgi:hypothetical protein
MCSFQCRGMGTVYLRACVHAQVSSIGEWTFAGENGGVPKVDIIIC